MSKISKLVAVILAKYNQIKERSKLNCADFSIISNNCWAGTAVYQRFGLKYNTPTVGLFIMDEDYIEFLEHLSFYLNCDIEFINPKTSKFYSKISNNGKENVNYPIGLLGNKVEIHFLHYHDNYEALSKWERRKDRINFNRMLIKMSLRDIEYDQKAIIERFEALPFKNKICFSPKQVQSEFSNIVWVPELVKLNIVGGDETDCTLKYIDLLNILNNII